MGNNLADYDLETCVYFTTVKAYALLSITSAWNGLFYQLQTYSTFQGDIISVLRVFRNTALLAVSTLVVCTIRSILANILFTKVFFSESHRFATYCLHSLSLILYLQYYLFSLMGFLDWSTFMYFFSIMYIHIFSLFDVRRIYSHDHVGRIVS